MEAGSDEGNKGGGVAHKGLPLRKSLKERLRHNDKERQEGFPGPPGSSCVRWVTKGGRVPEQDLVVDTGNCTWTQGGAGVEAVCLISIWQM